MRTMHDRPWPRLLPVLLSLLLAAPAAAAHPPSVALDVEIARPAVLAQDRPQQAFVKISLTGKRIGREGRAPLNIAIVLDRSGSMAGTKIEEAKRAAMRAIGMLGPEDIVAVVTYESTVDVLIPATKARDKQQLVQAIRSITSAGNTALFGGVSRGAQELRKFLDPSRVNTLILLSDGLANVGPSSPGELAQLGASLAREGIAVTTIGLGLDYNEDLMARLALASDGNHFFVEDEGDLEYAFATEFGDALSAVAQGVTIHIHCPEGVRPVRVLGRDAQISGRDVHVSMNQLFKDQTRYLLLEVELPAAAAGRALPVATVDAAYRDLLTGARAQLRGEALVRYTDSVALVERETDPDVMIAVASQTATERSELAMALRDQGRVEEARAAYRSNAVYLEEEARRWAAPELEKEAAVQSDATENLDDARWNRERKVQQESQLKGKSQRAYAPSSSSATEKDADKQKKDD